MKFDESAIRPDDLFDEYLRLAKIDCINFFSDIAFEERKCPVCDSSGKYKYSKENFDYCSCINCQTIFINPCPNQKAFENFYRNSLSAKYWSEKFYKFTEDNRKELLWRPKFNFIKEYMDNIYESYGICDIGCGYGAFLDIASESLNSDLLIGIEPNADLANLPQKGHRIVNRFLNELSKEEINHDSRPTIFTCFELLEHLVDPLSFLQSIYGLMKTGDYLYLTTLSSLGIDISILGSASKSVSPPHHVLFINPISAKMLATKIGFSSYKIDTPGRLDFDILKKNSMEFRESSPNTYDFISSIPEELQNKFQNFIAENQMSSHLRMILKK